VLFRSIHDISATVFRDVRERTYMDVGHLTGLGNELVAKAIAQKIDECGLIPWTQ